MAAFLALMVLKLKNKEICEQKTPNDPNDVKKLFNFGIDDPLAFGLDFTTFVGLLKLNLNFLRRKLPKPQDIWFEAKNFFHVPPYRHV